MLMQKLAIREQIVKTVVKSGNGGAVWVPKDWRGKEVVVILPENPKLNLKEKIINLLEPYLKDAISVGIYGSYARNEQTPESDLDILFITKDKNLKLKLKEEKVDVVSFSIGNLKKAIEKYPVVYYQMVQETEPIFNADVLEELKNTEVSRKSFRAYLKETGEHLKSGRAFLELDKIDSEYIVSYSVLYSAVLRLKGIFIINCILKKDKFSNKAFKKWLIRKGLKSNEIETSFKIYRLIRDDENIKGLKIRVASAEKILNILEKEVSILEGQMYGK